MPTKGFNLPLVRSTWEKFYNTFPSYGERTRLLRNFVRLAILRGRKDHLIRAIYEGDFDEID